MRLFAESNENIVIHINAVICIINALYKLPSVQVSDIGKLIVHNIEKNGSTHTGTYLGISEDLLGLMGEIKIYYSHTYYYICYVDGFEGFWNIQTIVEHIKRHTNDE